MLFIVFPLSFSALVMLLIFAVLIGGTGVAFWKMLRDPTQDVPAILVNVPASPMPVSIPDRPARQGT